MAGSRKLKGAPRMRWLTRLLQCLVITMVSSGGLLSVGFGREPAMPRIKSLGRNMRKRYCRRYCAKARDNYFNAARLLFRDAGRYGRRAIYSVRALFRDDPVLFGLRTLTSISVDIDFRGTVNRTK